jgi:hypothetical protein
MAKSLNENLVIGAGVDPCRPRVALSGTAADQLTVDSRRSVRFADDDMQAARLGDVRFELNVGSATGHVGRNRDPSTATRLCNDVRFCFGVSGIQHDVIDCRGSE